MGAHLGGTQGAINKGGRGNRPSSLQLAPKPLPRATSPSCSRGSSNPECDASSRMCGLRGGAALAAQGRAVREVVHATALPASICTTPTRYRSSATVRLVVIP